MSDRATPDAWQVTPDRYLEAHPPRFGGASDRSSCYVTVRDGTRLAVDVYLPADRGEERLPAILVFTPYYRRFALIAGAPDSVEAAASAAAYRDAFVPHGYALVVVDTRGAGASFGTRDGFRSPVETTSRSVPSGRTRMTPPPLSWIVEPSLPTARGMPLSPIER